LTFELRRLKFTQHEDSNFGRRPRAPNSGPTPAVNKPKQFQPVLGDKSLFTDTIDTLLTAFPPEDIFISTKQKFIKYASDQAPRIPLRNYLVEPNIAKDRGPAEGFVMAKLSLMHPGEPFFFVQADCIRKPEAEFIQMIKDAEALVKARPQAAHRRHQGH
jgi:mannose-1-phosphate guanylyltransferase